MFIRDFMTSPVVSIAANAMLEEAMDMMLENKVSALPVVDDGGQLIGVISEFDTLIVSVNSAEQFNPVVPVTHFMSADVQTIEADQPLAIAIDLFTQKPFRRLPVVCDGKLVGILSRRDVVRAIRERREQIVDWNFTQSTVDEFSP